LPSVTTSSLPHISVCICTFRRPALLKQLLNCVAVQQTAGAFSYDVVVADNDIGRSAEAVAIEFAAAGRIPTTYCVEPEQNISLARNRVVAAAKGDLLAFIDDDELPGPTWLLELLSARSMFAVDGVLGPVLPAYQQKPPQWLLKGRFYDRPRHQTGTIVKWPEARTGNVLIESRICRDPFPPFRPELGSGGEDVDFFRRQTERGRSFVWCDEAAVHEIVPPYRCTRRFLMHRAVLRGSNFPKQRGHRVRNIAKSLIAVPCYTCALPVLAIAGHHFFMAYLVKVLDHSSRLLALAGMPLLSQRET
jgi:succinoglycan biosynthesis protein ExoM